MAQIEKVIKQERGGIFKPVKKAINWFASLFRHGRSLLMNVGDREVVTDITATTAITQGFNGNTAVYSIIKKDANKFASIPRFVYDTSKLKTRKKFYAPNRYIKSYNRDAVLVNALAKLLERPNPMQGQAAFFKTARGFFKTCGETFIWLLRDLPEYLPADADTNLYPILEMYVLPSNKVSLVPDPNNMWGVRGYIFEVGGIKLPIRKTDIIHWKDVNLNFDATTREHLRGMPALKPGEETLQANNDAERTTVRMYQNDGAKGALYGEDRDGISPDQETIIRGVVDRKVNNNDVKGAVATLMGVGKMGYLNFGGTSVDMELLEGKKMSWWELCNLFDVPYELFQSETTFANKEQAQKSWVSNSILPANYELDDELNRVLLRAFKLEGRAVIGCDATELPELQANMKELSEWLEKSPEITPNEKRIAKGYEPYKDPLMDEPWVDGRPLSERNADDGFDAMAAELGVETQRTQKKPEEEVVKYSLNGNHVEA
jgi:HK97 family phage portal protein